MVKVIRFSRNNMKEMAHCLVCGEPMGLKHLMGKRKTCSDKCRKAKQRKELKEGK